MQIVIDISEEEYNECVMQVEMMEQEGIIIESLNTALLQMAHHFPKDTAE